MGSANQIRVLLVDDDVRIRHTLSSILKSYSNIELDGEASDDDQALLVYPAIQRLMAAVDRPTTATDHD
jgi:chemotaxis response regulator CheB